MLRNKKTIIVGHTGQDGSLLLDSLKKRGDSIIGISRSSFFLSEELSNLVIKNIADVKNIYEVLRLFKPDEIYYLPAYHNSSEDLKSKLSLHLQFENANYTHVIGAVNFLSAIKEVSPQTRFFYASSSMIYNGTLEDKQDENARFDPKDIYGITKTQGMLICRMFREKYKIFASTGILYNHESHLRSQNFISTKIILAAIRISKGSKERLEIGNLSSRVDFGYAKDFVEAFKEILSLDQPDDFIVATGESHTIEEFVDIVFDYFSLNAIFFVLENNKILQRHQPLRAGDPSKLKKISGWKPSYSFKNFVIQLIKDHEEAIASNKTD